jgi:hypothetical protein
MPVRPRAATLAVSERRGMRAAVVYESWFGNTRTIAEAIARGLGESYQVTLCTVDEAPLVGELDLLVVGAPTQVHGLSSETSRKAALERRGTDGEPGIGARGYLEGLPHVDGLPAAAFDTRVDRPALVVGSAARGIAKRLERRGFVLAAPPASFFVGGTPGPLAPDEVVRAVEWGRSLAAVQLAIL